MSQHGVRSSTSPNPGDHVQQPKPPAPGPAPYPPTTNERWVSVAGSDGAAGTQAAPWRHIQYAVDHAPPSPPPVIHVRAGKYEEQVHITHPVKIHGAGVDAVKIQNPVNSTYTYPGGLPDVGDPSFVILAEGDFNAELANLTVNGRHTSVLGTPGIKADGVGLTLDHVDVLVPFRVGIVFTNLDLHNRAFHMKTCAVKTLVKMNDFSTAMGEYPTDLGVQIIDSSGVISHFTGGTEIDHVLHIFGGRDILVEDSTIYGGTQSYYADGIRAWSGNIRIVRTSLIRPAAGPLGNSIFPAADDPIYAPQRPYAGIECVNVGKAPIPPLHLEVDRCRIQGFDEGVGIFVHGGPTGSVPPHRNTIKIQNSKISGHTADVGTRWRKEWTEHPMVDFGGGPLGSEGANTFGSPGIPLPGPPFPMGTTPWLFYHRGPYALSAKGNHWPVPNNKIDDRVFDRLDVHHLGRVEH